MKTCPSCGNRKVNGLICLNCGYDFKNPPVQIRSAESNAQKAPAQNLDIWLGTFPSKKAFETYFSEFDEWEDGEPVSPFAKEQGIIYYDHDFFVAEYFSKTSDLEKIVSSIIVYDDRAKEIVVKYQQSGIGKVNFVAMQLEELGIEGKQRTVVGKNYAVHYLGRFSYSGMKN